MTTYCTSTLYLNISKTKTHKKYTHDSFWHRPGRVLPGNANG